MTASYPWASVNSGSETAASEIILRSSSFDEKSVIMDCIKMWWRVSLFSLERAPIANVMDIGCGVLDIVGEL